MGDGGAPIRRSRVDIKQTTIFRNWQLRKNRRMKMSIEMIEIEEFNQGTQIKVIGVGGGGGNAVEHMISRAVQGVEFICANTDAQALARGSAHKTIQLGQSGLGAGSKPE